MSLHYIDPDLAPCSGELTDYNSSSEKIIDWKSRKIYTDIIADSFKRLGDIKTFCKLHYCGTDLEFKVFSDGTKKLHNANFCRHRMCSMCAWRRSLKKYAQVSQMMAYLDKYEYNYIFVTLTVKNCSGHDLNRTIDALLKGYNDLFRLKDIKKAFLGAFRSLEITYNYDRAEFHPHIHMIVAVRKSYFTSRDYISTRKMVALWKSCMDLSYDPIIDVRKVDDENCNLAHAVAEVAKYSVKTSDYTIPYDLDVQDYVVGLLSETLCGRRLSSVRGVFRDAQRALKIDLEDQDLVKTDLETEMNPQLEYMIEHYKWDFDTSRYMHYVTYEPGENDTTK